MLSDISDDTTMFAASLSAARTDSGDSTYFSYTLGLRYRPLKWLQFTATIPYLDIEGEELFWDQVDIGGGVMADRATPFEYETDGLGDVVVMGWVDLAYPFLPPPVEVEEEGLIYKDVEGFDDPSVYLGLGVKLDTGEHDEFDYQKYLFDRSKAITGEFSDSDGIIPSRFQTGSGTTDLLAGAVYYQRFGRWVPTAGISYQYVTDENSVGYERSDVLSWSVGTKYIILNLEDCRQFYIRGGISGSRNLSSDKDHSEDTTLLGSQKKGNVPGTKGTWNFYDIGIGYDITKQMTLSAAVKLPLTSTDDRSGSSFDRQLGISLQYRF